MFGLFILAGATIYSLIRTGYIHYPVVWIDGNIPLAAMYFGLSFIILGILLTAIAILIEL